MRAKKKLRIILLQPAREITDMAINEEAANIGVIQSNVMSQTHKNTKSFFDGLKNGNKTLLLEMEAESRGPAFIEVAGAKIYL